MTPADADELRATFAEAHRRYTGAIYARFRWTGHLFQGRFGAVVMDEPHLLAAARYIALHPVVAGLVSLAEDWPWWSTRAQLAGEDDELATVAPLRALIPDFAALLAMPTDAAMTTERRLGRPSASRKPGPKPRVEHDTARQAPLAAKRRVNCQRNPNKLLVNQRNGLLPLAGKHMSGWLQKIDYAIPEMVLPPKHARLLRCVGV